MTLEKKLWTRVTEMDLGWLNDSGVVYEMIARKIPYEFRTAQREGRHSRMDKPADLYVSVNNVPEVQELLANSDKYAEPTVIWGK